MHVMFDFDGTIVDSFHCVVEKFTLLADEFHLHKIKPEEFEHLRDLSSTELIKFLGISFYKIPKLISQTRKYLHHEMYRLMPIAEMPIILQELNQAGLTLGIITSNSAENVTIWLRQHNLQHLFKFICIESSIFSKQYVLKKILKKHKIDPLRAFYIGDETRDIEAAKQNQVRSIAVTWGYNSKKALVKAQPDYIVNKPVELLFLKKEELHMKGLKKFQG